MKVLEASQDFAVISIIELNENEWKTFVNEKKTNLRPVIFMTIMSVKGVKLLCFIIIVVSFWVESLERKLFKFVWLKDFDEKILVDKFW